MRGFEAVIESDVPIGGGLSSSAALEVATATLVEAMAGARLEAADKARLCQRAECDFAGVPSGLMDQFTSVFGRADHFLRLDCRSCEVRFVPLRDATVSVLVVNTNVKHELSGGEYAARRAQTEQAAAALGVSSLRDATGELLAAKEGVLDPTVFRRARHVISEIERTWQAATAVERADWDRVGGLMYASHDSLRDDFAVSCRELDLVVAAARDLGPGRGVIGCRLTGGGFGGCCVALVRTAAAAEIAAAIRERYEAATGIVPEIFLTRPAAGAAVLSL